MFTGIIQGTALVDDIIIKENFYKYYFLLSGNLTKNLEIGASVSINGCCLTVTSINYNNVVFDVVQETFKLTNFKYLKIGDRVNIERSLNLQSEIGGHILSGHIFCTAHIVDIEKNENFKIIKFKLKNIGYLKYIFYKNYIGIDGISMTISKLENNYFFVNVVPTTLDKTTLKYKEIGSVVNIEIDSMTYTLVNVIERSICAIKNK